MKTLHTPIALVVFVGYLLGQSRDGFPGTWKSSAVTDGQGLPLAGRSHTETIHAIQNGLQLKHEWTSADGKSHFQEFSCIFDGKPHPMDRPDAKHRTHTVVCRRLDDRTIEITVDHDEGVEVTKNRRILARDGLTMQAIYYESGDRSNTVQNTILYDRQ